ncbi:MAG: hypothetical protein L6R40_006430 [Gallowayella cf. fulva]|nr:MAG: hypothetical protein L6R40_006430 [Xanthomendoza cf. fulva]
MAVKRLLEVETKFLTPKDYRNLSWGKSKQSLVATLWSKQGNPAFKRLEALDTHIFTDTYYDHQDILSRNGIWLRQRRDKVSATLEAKVRISGDFKSSTFDEITDRKSIAELIRPHFQHLALEKEGFGLDLLAKFTTKRQQFLADQFTVVLDDTDFGHSVGEVEMMAEDEAKAHREIDGFMARYPWFFLRGKVEGKLEAYLRAKARNQAG